MGKVIRFAKDSGGSNMYIGGILKERMQALGVNEQTLAKSALLDPNFLSDIIKDKVKSSDISPLSLKFISKVLYCEPEYFTDEDVRGKDILFTSMNRGITDVRTNLVKGRLQQFANDFMFLQEIIQEVEGGV